MAKRSKVIIALCGIAAGIIIGIIIVTLNQQDFISEDEAKAVVTERYGGSVESVSLSDDDRYYIINLKGESATHSIKVDREDSSVEGIETIAKNSKDEQTASNNTKDAEADQTKESTEEKTAEEQKKEKQQQDAQKQKEAKEAADKKKEQPEEKAKDKEQTETTEKQPESNLLTVDEAVNTAAQQVGGTNVYSTWNGEGENREYYILQRVNDDDEGALVSINGVSGHVNKVVWMEIDDDYAKMEQMVHEAAQYANTYDGRYIDYDEDYFENDDDDYDDDYDDDDYDDDYDDD